MEQSIDICRKFFLKKTEFSPPQTLNQLMWVKLLCIALLLKLSAINALAQCNMATPSNQTLCNGASTTAINFTGATSYSWTNSNPAIGLAASGTGNIGSFTATNNTASPITATITVTPSSPGSNLAYIPTVTSNVVNVINTLTNTVSGSIPVSNYPIGVSVSPDGSRAYITNTGAGNVTVINTSTNAIITVIPGFSNPYSLAVSPDGTKLFVANQTGATVSVVNTASNTITGTITGMNGPNAIAFTPDGTKAYVTNNFNGTVAVVNTTTNTIITTIPGFASPVGIAMSPDGTKAYVANQNAGNVAVINTTTNTISTTIGVLSGNPFGVCVSPDGTLVYSANLNSNTISKINATTNTLITNIPVGNFPQGIQVSSDNSKVYVACDVSNAVYVLNTATNAVITTIGTGVGPKALGNFLTPGNCTGTPVSFTITVNPTPAVSVVTSPPGGPVFFGYGTLGGPSNSGVMFKYDVSSNSYTSSHSFSNSPDGHFPAYSPFLASDGNIYGTTPAGGTSNFGTLFKYNLTTNTYTKLVDFTGFANGQNPETEFVQIGNFLYGTTSYGGTLGNGTVYRFDITTNTLTVVHNKSILGQIVGGMVNIAGTLFMVGLNGGNFNAGFIAKFNTATNILTKIHDFSGFPGPQNPFGSFTLAPNGKLYGMTEWGGANFFGLIYEFDPNTNIYVTKRDFTGTSGLVPGKNPRREMALNANGKLYGSTSLGGANDLGVIFEYDPATNNYTKLYDFGGSTGVQPGGMPMFASDGNLYGMTFLGGANNKGTIYRFNISSNTYTKLYDFVNATGGSNHYGRLIQSGTSSTVTTCTGSPITLSGSGATSYAWTGGITNAVSFNASSGTTVYNVTGTDANGCTGTSSATVIGNPLPTASAGGTATICQNGSHTVSGATSANGTRLWTHNGAGTISNATTLTPTYNAAAGDAGNTVTLTMTVSNAPCANATATYTINVSATPTAVAGGSQTICQTGTATVPSATATNGTIVWTHNGFGSFAGSPTSSLLMPTYTAAAGDAGTTVTLTMTVSNSPCANAVATHQVIVKATPTASAGGTATICQNGSNTVSGATSANGTRLWTHNGVGTISNATTLTPTYNAAAGDAGNTVTLTMTVSNAPCASATATYTISVTASPTVSFSGSSSTCESQAVVISDATVTNNTSHSWSIISGNGSLTNTVGLTPTYTPVAADAGTNVIIRLTVSNSPCANAFADKTISIDDRPTLNTATVNICTATPVGTINVVAPLPLTDYKWSPAADLFMDALLTVPYVFGTSATTVYTAPFVNTSYSVTATNASGCTTGATSVNVIVCSAITNDICQADAPTPAVNVTTTATFVTYSLLGATASPGIPCSPIARDVYYRVVVPSNGELHVITAPGTNAVSSLNVQSTVVSIHYAVGGTCTTSPVVACNSGGAAGNHSYVSHYGMTPGSIAYIRLGSTVAGNSNSAQFVRMAVTSGLIWTGSANSSFNNPANWMGGDASALTVPDLNKSVILRPVTTPAVAPIVSGAQTVKSLTMLTSALLSINSGATLDVKGNNITLASNNILGNGTVVLSGTASQSISGSGRINYLKINNASGVTVSSIVRVGGLDLQQGVVTTNNNLTLLSEAGLTGYLNNFTGGYTGSLSGNLNVERRVVLGSTPNASPDHYLASPVAMTGTVSSNYNDDFSVVGSPAGYVYNTNPAVPQPSVFPTTWTYDETQTIATIPGWTGAGATTLAPGQGFSARVVGTRILDIMGIANNGGISRTVTYTDDGLNLVGNPYPSSINFSTFASANASTILPVLYIWNPANSTYASWAGGIWSNNPAGSGASDVIGHSQSFFVFATQSGNVSFSNSMRTVNQAANFFADPEGLIRLEVSSNGQTDEAVVATNTEATENYDSQVDAKKLLNALTPSILAFTLSADNTPLAINAMDKFSTEQVIPVQIIAPKAGEVSIKLNMADLKGRFDHIYLEDATLGTYTDLKATESYTATVSQGNSGSRFFLHFEKPSIAGVTNELGVYAANSSVFANLPSESNGTIEVVDLVGKTIYTANFAGKSGRVEFVIPNAVYGSYIVKLTSNGKVSNKKIVLSE